MGNAGGDAASATAAAGDSGVLADDRVRPVEMPDEEEYRWGAF